MPNIRPFQLNAMAALPMVGMLYISGVSANLETVVIDGRTYEFTDGALIGDVQINVPNGSNAAVSAAGVVAAVNGDALATVEALVIGGDVVAFVGIVPGVAALTLVETMVNGIVNTGATMVGGVAESRLALVPGAYAVEASDVTALAAVLGTSEVVLGAFPSTTMPRLLSYHCRRAGVDLSLADARLRMAQLAGGTNFWALIYREPAGGALLAAADEITFVLGVPAV